MNLLFFYLLGVYLLMAAMTAAKMVGDLRAKGKDAAFTIFAGVFVGLIWWVVMAAGFITNISRGRND